MSLTGEELTQSALVGWLPLTIVPLSSLNLVKAVKI